MKKLLLFCSIISIILMSCKDGDKSSEQNSTATKSELSASSPDTILKSLPDSLAIKMIKHFKNSTKKPKNVLWASFDPRALARIASDTTVVSIKFFAAAYLPDNSDSSKKNFPTIVMQVIKHDLATVTTTIVYYEANSYCPPPYDSDCPIVEAQYMTSAALNASPAKMDSAALKKKK